MPPDLREWPKDHLAWFVIEAIDEFELGRFYAGYRADGHSRAAHDPKIMVCLLVYAYCVGEHSSRRIERRCLESDRAQRLELCRHRLIEEWRAEHKANRAYAAYRARGVMKDGRRFGRPPDPYTPPAQPTGRSTPPTPTRAG